MTIPISGIPEALQKLQLPRKIQIEAAKNISQENQQHQNKTKNAGIKLFLSNFIKNSKNVVIKQHFLFLK